MFIIDCDCGYEIFVSSNDDRTVWQCEQCGKWLNFFGQQVPGPDTHRNETLFQDFDPDFYDEE